MKKDQHLRARLPVDEKRKVVADADAAGLTTSEHVRCILLRDRQALSQEQLLEKQEQFLAEIDAKLAAIPQPVAAAKTESDTDANTDLEPLVVEAVLLARELVAERNPQALARIAQHLNNLYPGRKKT